MKMAKPSDEDIRLAMDIARIVEDLEQRYRPELVFGEDDQELWLDTESIDELQAVVEKIREIAARGSIFRVVFGMAVAIDPKNAVFDPDADTLELHPILLDALRDAKRYRHLRTLGPGRLLDEIADPALPNEGLSDELDRAIDELIDLEGELRRCEAAMETDE